MRHLTFQTSSVQLLPSHLLYVQRFKEHLRDFGELNDIVVVVKAPNLGAGPALHRSPGRPDQDAARRRPGRRIGSIPICSRGRRCSISRASGSPRSATRCSPTAQFIEEYAARPTLPGLFDGIGGEIARRLAGASSTSASTGQRHGCPRRRPVRLRASSTRCSASSPRASTAPARSSRRGLVSSRRAATRRAPGYFSSADDRLLFILVEPRRDASNFTDNEHFIEAIRGTIASLRPEFPDVQAGTTGTPALSNDEMLTAFHDSTIATGAGLRADARTAARSSSGACRRRSSCWRC